MVQIDRGVIDRGVIDRGVIDRGVIDRGVIDRGVFLTSGITREVNRYRPNLLQLGTCSRREYAVYGVVNLITISSYSH
jgi:hypothetical protein